MVPKARPSVELTGSPRGVHQIGPPQLFACRRPFAFFSKEKKSEDSHRIIVSLSPTGLIKILFFSTARRIDFFESLEPKVRTGDPVLHFWVPEIDQPWATGQVYHWKAECATSPMQQKIFEAYGKGRSIRLWC